MIALPSVRRDGHPARRIRGAVVMTISLALAACGGEKAPEQAAAKGELLPRSVTDEMPPYDTVKSQPSLMAPEQTGAAGSAAADAPAASGSATSAQGSGEDAPIATPTPETTSPAPAAE